MLTLHIQQRRLGTSADFAGKPYAEFWNPHLAPLAQHAREAVLAGPIAAPLLPALEETCRTLLDEGDAPIENGYALQSNGALHVAIRTDMPGVSPEMIDWWFGWHGEEPQRYQLWHPLAHVNARWDSPTQPGLHGRNRYLGRTSFVHEYLGSEIGHFSIRFIRPSEIGLNESRLSDPSQATAICARVGFGGVPVDAGYLIHHVRRTAAGSEMRSRFWLGGPNAGGRHGSTGWTLAANAARLVLKPKMADGQNLLVHCAQEMAHLAAFLPRLFAKFGQVEGRLLK